MSRPIKNGYLEDMHLFWISAKTREIFIHGVDRNADAEYDGEETGVEFMMANRVIKNLHYLLHRSRTEPVTCRMMTCGGDWIQGIAIYDTIRLMPYHVTIVSYTHARSMSSIILQAGDDRVLLPNSYFLFHQGSCSFSGTYKEACSGMEFDKKCDRKMIDIYIEKCIMGKKFKGKSVTFVRNAIEEIMKEKSDVYFTPEEAIEWGFADRILEEF